MSKKTINILIIILIISMVGIFSYLFLFNKNEKEIVIEVETITLNNNKLSLVIGDSKKLSVTINPSDATNKSVSWSSSNSNIVTVDNGKLTAKEPGEVVITATTTNGKIATCNVKVENAIIFNLQNSVITKYFKNVSDIVNIYKDNDCANKNCVASKKYKTSLSGEINVYEYNNGNKKYIVTTKSSKLKHYLLPGEVYYLESKSDTSKFELVKITGKLHGINGVNVGNMRDLGGWKTEENTTIKYGFLYRSASSSSLIESDINYLNIKRIVDLRRESEIENPSEDSNKIRKIISVSEYSISSDSNVREAITEIMTSIVAGKNVLFNCAIGQDRTGTIAYIIEGILGVTLENRKRDYEISYFTLAMRTRNDDNFNRLINEIDKYSKNKYEQEKFINWFLSTSSNKNSDLDLINKFRKKMIKGKAKEYKLSNDELVLA